MNRRYQRKLVWSEQEKRHLVDSIEHEFPIPLFMLNRNDGEDVSFEIIDGMQRFNAIFSFIEHQFLDENGKCFDLEQFSRARISREAGVFVEYAPEIPRMSAVECAKFLEYQLAVTIDSEGNEERINEIFGRINSSGRQLSAQEQRQAGLVSELSEFVRRLSMELRGDSSPDVLALNQMPEVSVNTPRERQRYGIDASDIFWCRHGIITAKDLAKGEDEQIITDIAISIVNGVPLNRSREVLDEYFNPEIDVFKNFNSSIISYGAERLKNEVIATVSAIRSVFEDEGFTSFRSCVQEKTANTARGAFYAVFMAVYDLMFKESKFPHDFPAIRAALSGSQTLLNRSAHHTTTADRQKDIGIITGLIQGAFVKKDVATLSSSHGLVVEVENSLRRARYEASRYEFKIGICSLSDKPALDMAMYSKLGRTACAIANTNPGADGYMYLGVADNEASANRVNELFGIEPLKIGEVFFVGLGHDLQVLNTNIEGYVKNIINRLSELPISDPLLTQIITSIDHAEYQGRPFIRLRVPQQSDLSTFAGSYPVRKNSDTVDMTPAEAVAQSKLFQTR
ncbi:DUF262 domain-containing protein [Devosia sp. Naph2]|uniref:GmrSD restriction endonuclease domain-containing protein n=1 Tax=Devosia polycyclovorans TaxID=3345148 RepID=UPI0035CFBE63